MTRSAVRIVVGLSPLWILLLELALAPDALEILAANPPAIAGLPIGLLLVAAALVLMSVGVVVLRRTSSGVATLFALMFLTVPAAYVVVVAPALITRLMLSE